jgi:hypothetical protein
MPCRIPLADTTFATVAVTSTRQACDGVLTSISSSIFPLLGAAVCERLPAVPIIGAQRPLGK